MAHALAAPARPTARGPDRGGDVDIAAVGSLLANPGRCRVLLALSDGRALPASTLAAEAGVAPSTASVHLARLVDAGLLAVECHGRHRYYRLAHPDVGAVLEALARLAPTRPVRSLREGTKAAALRCARTCYDHLAGRLGVAVMAAMIDRGHLSGHDGTHNPARAVHDRLSAPGQDVDYRLTASGRCFLTDLGAQVPPGGIAVRYCIDWSEQRHHLAGTPGRLLLARLVALDWLRRDRASRILRPTPEGRAGLRERLGIAWE